MAESLLSRLRDGKLSLTPEFTSGLLAMVDAIRTMLGEIQTTRQDGNETYTDLIEPLNRLQNHGHQTNPHAGANALLPEEHFKKHPAISLKESTANSVPSASISTKAKTNRILSFPSRPPHQQRRRKNPRRRGILWKIPAPRTRWQKQFAWTSTCWTGLYIWWDNWH